MTEPAADAGSLRATVIIPCRNCASFLAETLQSALDQSRPPEEIIVVDDGSTDGSAEIAEAAGDPVRLVRLAPQGVSAARNRGVREARADVIAFLDADDLWHPDKLQHQLTYLEAHPDTGAVVTSVAWFRDREAAREPYLQVTDGRLRRSTPADFLIHPWVNQSAVAIRTAIAREVRYPEGVGDSEDMLQAVELRLRTTIGATSDVLAFYRHHDGQATSRRDHSERSLAVRVRWAAANFARLGAASPDAAVLPILQHRLADITPLYWRRDIARFRHERDIVRRLWPASQPKPWELTRLLLPARLLRLRDRFFR